jgi:hypothetical protein
MEIIMENIDNLPVIKVKVGASELSYPLDVAKALYAELHKIFGIQADQTTDLLAEFKKIEKQMDKGTATQPIYVPYYVPGYPYVPYNPNPPWSPYTSPFLTTSGTFV